MGILDIEIIQQFIPHEFCHFFKIKDLKNVI